VIFIFVLKVYLNVIFPKLLLTENTFPLINFTIFKNKERDLKDVSKRFNSSITYTPIPDELKEKTV